MAHCSTRSGQRDWNRQLFDLNSLTTTDLDFAVRPELMKTFVEQATTITPELRSLAKETPPVFGMIERGGQVVIHLLANVKQKVSQRC